MLYSKDNNMFFPNHHPVSQDRQAIYVNVQNVFNNALKLVDVEQRCTELTKLIQEALINNIKELHNIFIQLIESIFGFGSQNLLGDWGLKSLVRSLNPREFDAIYSFLHPNGQLFQLIRQLMADPVVNKYEFPRSALPKPTQTSLDEGAVPCFYINKLTHVFANSVMLNAFEFYLFHFTYFITNTSSQLNNTNVYSIDYLNSDSNNQNTVYFVLLEAYLESFVPLIYQSTSNIQPFQESSIWKSLSSTTSNLLHFGSSTSDKFPTSKPSLFKPVALNQNLQSSQNNLNDSIRGQPNFYNDLLKNDVWKCETTILIMSEMWLNHSLLQFYLKKQPNASPTHQQMLTPTADHLRAVRILVKHLHFFANSLSKKCNSFASITPIDEVKKLVWTQKYDIRKRLYLFLRLSFDRWPNDASFRLPLETWLSYIQPWRYVNANESKQLNVDSDEATGTNRGSLDLSVDWQWKQFITDNLLFYTVIFKQLIPRFTKHLDLTSSKNALMLFRMAKVFSQSQLASMIKEAESLPLHDSAVSPVHLTPGRSLLSPSLRHSTSVNFKCPLIELEPVTADQRSLFSSSSYEYVGLFSHATKSQINQLLKVIVKAKDEIANIIASETFKNDLECSQKLGIFKIFSSIFNSNDCSGSENKLLNEKRKAEIHLDQSLSKFSQIFEMPLNFGEAEQFNQTPTRSSSRSIPEIISNENGTPKLTQFGRDQVLSGKYKSEITSLEGNPDLQPVRSFEIAFMVKILMIFSNWINSKCGSHIENFYNMPGFLGIFFKQFISPPATYIKVHRKGISRPPERRAQVLPPRISLRFMASKFILGYSLLLLSVVYILGYDITSFVMLMLFMFLTYTLTKSLLIFVSSE